MTWAIQRNELYNSLSRVGSGLTLVVYMLSLYFKVYKREKKTSSFIWTYVIFFIITILGIAEAAAARSSPEVVIDKGEPEPEMPIDKVFLSFIGSFFRSLAHSTKLCFYSILGFFIKYFLSF